MINKSTLIGKTFKTLITFIRFLSIVYSLMNYRIIFIGKKLITMVTFKRLLASHRCEFFDEWKLNIFGQNIYQTDYILMASSTECALMHHHKAISIGRTYITLVTFKRLFIIVCSLICHNSTFISKSFIILFTFKRILATVCYLVNYKMSYFNKTFITLITLKRLFSTVC